MKILNYYFFQFWYISKPNIHFLGLLNISSPINITNYFLKYWISFRCLNEQCEPILDIYVSRAFQWYKERHKPLNFDPSNRSLKFWKSTGTPSPKVGVALGTWVFTPHTPSHFLTFPGVCDVTPSFPFGSHPCNAFALTPELPSSWPATLQALCLGREPKAGVATVWRNQMLNLSKKPSPNQLQKTKRT
jgi:hypothetical protein